MTACRPRRDPAQPAAAARALGVPLLLASCALAASLARAQAGDAAARPPAGTASTPAAPANDPPVLRQAEGMVMFSYQSVAVPQRPGIDLAGMHLLQRLTDEVYAGVGAYGPLVRGEYGGFMAFDATLHAQRRLWGDVFANAGVGFGGGGGGKSKAQAKELSGTGQFHRAYVGLGRDFGAFSLGANLSTLKFRRSPIDGTQLDLFLQIPFSYTVGPYARAGSRLSARDAQAADDGGTTPGVFSVGLDNFVQINPTGSNKSTIRVIDLQYAHDLAGPFYGFGSLGVGVAGLRHYNQIVGGLGYRVDATPRLRLSAQLGVGSGGWAPDTIDTGPGLLVYPRLGAEYLLTRGLGVAVTAGYMAAPEGTSKNRTYGLALTYRPGLDRPRAAGADTADAGRLQGWRMSLGHQWVRQLRVDGQAPRSGVDLLTGQLDAILGDHVYLPLQAAVAVGSYLDYPGYGEFLTGLGLQTRHARGDRFQLFAQVLAGPNIHGKMAKADAIVHYSLSDRFALQASVGRTLASSPRGVNFKGNYYGLGVVYRFAVPSR